MDGRLGFNENDEPVFRGVWRGRDGQIIGHYRGHLEISDNGRNIFVGKWIDLNGRFEGFIKGIFEQILDDRTRDRENAYGWFGGKIYNSSREPIGDLKGLFMSASDDSRGFMVGRWKIGCISSHDNSMTISSDENDGF
jgi:hypothetical protein